MAQAGSKNICESKYKVKFDTRTVRRWVLPLLMRIGAGDYLTEAGRMVGLSRQHAWYYVRKLDECGLVAREKRSNVVFYRLTEESKNLVMSCDGKTNPGRVLRFDKCQMAYEVLVEGRLPSDF